MDEGHRYLFALTGSCFKFSQAQNQDCEDDDNCNFDDIVDTMDDVDSGNHCIQEVFAVGGICVIGLLLIFGVYRSIRSYQERARDPKQQYFLSFSAYSNSEDSYDDVVSNFTSNPGRVV
mmetsp:Transcript_25168/g.38722  ORF Transcript_25168/g.38722 Transcript_25168/m.38722 type:complete len:119 (+) Transcript_25168:83-439(+)|eukprot:CAMPEP_0118673164 /NCGR_PEP_ID=MMETSP0800-20121206/166_1 /TAXON_ID=210618 ORGANISM="Striatella unipunctata, Strain CCMP2910" /NCGR_SAMPLE_ID=MMETSP0800 /ASSEMBLY_ACC=CAM_ASM_000638 /LENGTH=118 /DNA_ID=CAMNT_0006568189 /DNA_START=60 /DNA_END=416 /DNA_ORIENTATION=+